MLYSNDPKFSDRQVWANRADPDLTAPEGANLLCPNSSYFYCILKTIFVCHSSFASLNNANLIKQCSTSILDTKYVIL